MIPIFKPFMPDELIPDIEEILYSGRLSFGENGRLFEKKLSFYIGNSNILTTSSYNNALLIVLSTLNLKPGDEIIASPVSCLASSQPFVVKGLKVKWADVDPYTGTLSADDVRSKISTKTKAIFHNHHCGFVGNIEAINKLGQDFGIPVIDDCIEAFGSELNNRKMGNIGTDVAIFSFQTVRLPNTIDGGAIVFNNSELLEKARLIRDYGVDRNNFRDNLNEINPTCDIKHEGYGALMGEINSYIGIKQLEVIDSLIEKQRVNAIAWGKKIKKYKQIQSLIPTQNSEPNYWVYGVLAEKKHETIKEFRKEGFYATGVHINNNIYSIFGDRTELKGVDEFIKRFVALPCGWWINSQLEYEK
jgi:dTDP-4-amino-4,6-dideoxygalactose transaminase